VQAVLFHTLAAYRLECSQANVQCDLGGLDSARTHLRENFASEMESRSRSGHGSTLTGVDRLVAVAIGGRIFAVDIWRQGNVAEFFQAFEEISRGREANMPFTKGAARNHLGVEFVMLPEEKIFTNANFSSGTNQTFPFVGFALQLASKQDFDASLEKLACRWIPRTQRLRLKPCAPTIEPRRKDASIVEDDEIRRPQKSWEVAEMQVLPGSGVPRRVVRLRVVLMAVRGPGNV
jgi:hypothetical protein